jgi:pyruvate dehydrogenase E1 component alpha subunit
VSGVRNVRDPIEYVKKLLVSYNLSTEQEIKAIEKDIRSSTEEALKKAKNGHFPPNDWLHKEIYSTVDFKDETLPFIRMPDFKKSIVNKI